ncbi:hypothetical protein [Staphylococcus sp. Marseille-Q5304]|uniref:hypothetical protein n=1 Tax=Staphylococcus sp. Marseille-Q5304 TaxID=2942200 RepID=UPI002072C81A|nr:hypothetical protein [Staphylococcus sp. Marseille-Q5304]
MKKTMFLTGSFLASTLAFTTIQQNVDAAETNSVTSNETQQSTTSQKAQSERPYGGFPPTGMTYDQYKFFEDKMPKRSEVSKEEYNKILNKETQAFASLYETTIYAPQKTFYPQPINTIGQTPYAGIPPKGMTNDEWDELTQRMPYLSLLTTKEYNRVGDHETQRIANKYNHVIYGPTKTYYPQKDSLQTSQSKSPYGGFPPTGMTYTQYKYFEDKMPKRSEVSKEEYNKILNKETQTFANIYETTIYAPQKTFYPQHINSIGQTPYAGLAPKGMTNNEWDELTQRMPLLSTMKSKEYERTINHETQRIANKYNHVIYAPQKTFYPQTQHTQTVSDHSKETLPETGQGQYGSQSITLGAGVVSMIVGVFLVSYKRVLKK